MDLRNNKYELFILKIRSLIHTFNLVIKNNHFVRREFATSISIRNIERFRYFADCTARAARSIISKKFVSAKRFQLNLPVSEKNSRRHRFRARKHSSVPDRPTKRRRASRHDRARWYQTEKRVTEVEENGGERGTERAKWENEKERHL